MTPPVIVRPARRGDLAAIAAIERVSFQDPWPDAVLLQELRPDRMRAPLVAEAAGEVLGYLMAWRVADELHIINLAVREDGRRRGTGTLLLRASIDGAAAHGVRLATLEVRLGNEGARDFYHRHGFSVRGLRRGYYSDTGEDALIMSRDLPAGPCA